MNYKRVLIAIVLFVGLLLVAPRIAITEAVTVNDNTIIPTIEVTPVTIKKRYLSTEDYVKDMYPPRFVDIIECESGFKPWVTNPLPYSSATGLAQIINGTWEYYGIQYWGEEVFKTKDRKDPFHNLDLAWYIYDTYGEHHWECTHAGFPLH